MLEVLDRYIPAVEIPLDHGNAFQLLVAVILSAQCTDARVNLVTPALFGRAPDARTMARLSKRQILPYIRTCGLAPGKASALARMSRILVAKHGGEVPADMAALEELPGVGHKTASVVMAQAFHQPAFPVDTHIHRLAGRWQLSRARNVEEVEHDLKAVFPIERWNTLHLQIIYFGRQYCTARQHDPAACPMCSWAMSKARAEAELRQGLSKPVRAPRAPRPRAGQPAERDTAPRTPRPRAGQSAADAAAKPARATRPRAGQSAADAAAKPARATRPRAGQPAPDAAAKPARAAELAPPRRRRAT